MKVRYFLVCEKNMWSLTVGMELRNAYKRCKNLARANRKVSYTANKIMLIVLA